MARLREQYKETILPELKTKFGRENILSLPRMEKVVINMGVGSATQDKKELADANAAMTLIAGQKPVITKARKSIANFRLREGQAIGCKVTLRGDRMYEFMDRLFSLALPRVRDFRGISEKAFDGRGNYSLGLTEYGVFPEFVWETTFGLWITQITPEHLYDNLQLKFRLTRSFHLKTFRKLKREKL